MKNQPVRLSLLATLSILLVLTFFVPSVGAVYDPASVPNNKFGIHIISAAESEASSAASLVNSQGGDWGYITVLIESKDRNHNKWQTFFDYLRRQHLIPIVRLTTQAEGNYWKRPYEKEEIAWADFLDSLNWPVKNRYVVIYNEPNHATEWGNTVDPKDYAQTLDKTITALKQKSEDFFVLNAGLDASAPQKPPAYMDEFEFLKQANAAVPGVFNRLDGWSSHSYPNPAFSGSPDANGKGSIRTWFWELQTLRSLGVTKNLPVFITETGWKHAEGINYDSSLLTADKIAYYYKDAFENAFASDRVVAVTPFLLDYQEQPFDHFSFKKPNGKSGTTGGGTLLKVLGQQYPDFYPQYNTLLEMPKKRGQPVQKTSAKLVDGGIYSTLVSGESYTVFLKVKNTGQSIWNDGEPTRLIATSGGKDLGFSEVEMPKATRVAPGQEYIFNFPIQAPLDGVFNIKLNLFSGQKQFEQEPFEFTTEVKAPVVLKVKSALTWKNNYAGDYVLTTKGAVGDSNAGITLNKEGVSPDIEARYLLPNYEFEFTLKKRYYQPKTIKKTLQSGINELDFGVLEPDLKATLLDLRAFLSILPWTM